MKVAVIGCGNISKVHFSALSEIPDVEVVAVADIKADRAAAAAEKCGAKAYDDFGKLIENEKPDAIHICTPHYLHTPMAVKALKSGINVLVEKPCSVSVDELKALREAQSESGKLLAVCFQNRYNSCVVQADKIIASGEMGKVRSIRAFVTWSRDEEYYSDDWHGTLDKECGGVLINQAIHTIDLIQHFGGKCKNVTAHVSNDHLKGIIEVEDNASVLMELENGVTAMLYATTAYSENSEVLIDIALERGVLRLEGEKLYRVESDGEIVLLCKKSEGVYHGESYWGMGHSVLIHDFYDCIKTGRNFTTDAFEGGHAAKIVAASYESSKINNTVTL